MSSRLLDRKRNETGADAAKMGVSGLSDFCAEWKISAPIARKVAKLDAMLQRYMIRHFKPLKAKPQNALRTYTTALLKHPQKWRLQALYEDGELDGEVCETVAVSESGAVIGRQAGVGSGAPVEGQLIELDVGDEKQRGIYGDVQAQHCKVLRMGSDFYTWAMETNIGTVVDGQKYRQND